MEKLSSRRSWLKIAEGVSIKWCTFSLSLIAILFFGTLYVFFVGTVWILKLTLMIATVTFKNYSVVKIIGNDLYSCNQRLRVKTAVEYFDLLFTVHFTFVCGCNLCISFLCRQKGAKSSAHGRFFNEKHSWYFVGVRNSLGSAKWLCHFSYLTLRQSSAYPQNIDTCFSKSLMRTNQAMYYSMI